MGPAFVEQALPPPLSGRNAGPSSAASLSSLGSTPPMADVPASVVLPSPSLQNLEPPPTRAIAETVPAAARVGHDEEMGHEVAASPILVTQPVSRDVESELHIGIPDGPFEGHRPVSTKSFGTSSTSANSTRSSQRSTGISLPTQHSETGSTPLTIGERIMAAKAQSDARRYITSSASAVAPQSPMLHRDDAYDDAQYDRGPASESSVSSAHQRRASVQCGQSGTACQSVATLIDNDATHSRVGDTKPAPLTCAEQPRSFKGLLQWIRTCQGFCRQVVPAISHFDAISEESMVQQLRSEYVRVRQKLFSISFCIYFLYSVFSDRCCPKLNGPYRCHAYYPSSVLMAFWK